MIVFVNATAARISGALTILMQFIECIDSNNRKGDQYYIFVSPEIVLDLIPNVYFIPIDTKKYIDRIRWDDRGIMEWAVKRNITPDKIVSFQNMGVNYPDVEQIIYFHQLLSIQKYKWNPFLKSQYPLFLYKNFYSYFVKKYINKQTIVVVQLEWIKDAFCKKFKFPKDRIIVLRPQIPKISVGSIGKMDLGENKKTHLFYPAMPFIYKNHMDIVKAIVVLEKENKCTDIVVHFTCDKDNCYDFVKLIRKERIESCFVFHGTITYQQMLNLYNSVDGLLFPSYIESFGLPLLEAAQFGLPIVCNDLPYVREVLADYEGKIMCELHHARQWSKAIFKVANNKTKYTPLVSDGDSSWSRFFELINN